MKAYKGSTCPNPILIVSRVVMYKWFYISLLSLSLSPLPSLSLSFPLTSPSRHSLAMTQQSLKLKQKSEICSRLLRTRVMLAATSRRSTPCVDS